MKPYYQEPAATIYQGHAIEVLKQLPDESVQMVITSPPYWGLRNYSGGFDIVWGGDEKCEHQWGDKIKRTGGAGNKTPSGFQQLSQAGQLGALAQTKWSESGSGQFCSLCGAWRGQLGLEPTPELYVEHLMMIFREVKRVLRKDGSFYLNIGDTYMSHPANSKNVGGFQGRQMEANPAYKDSVIIGKHFKGMADKCMVCIPERVMFAMIEDNWILRNKNIWHKPNPLPGSQKDRYSTTWEYLYFFVKNTSTILWRNRETGEWRDTRPTKDENYPWGGMYQNPETLELSWQKQDGWLKLQPLWMGFDYYFDLDSVRVPHTTQSLERYQRGVNLDRPAIGKSAEVGPMQQYKRAPQWFQDQFPPDEDYKGKFDDLFGHGPNPQSFNLRIRDVKRGKGGATAQGGELKASEKEVEEYEYPEKARKEDIFPREDHNPQPGGRSHFGVGSVISDRYKDSEVRGNPKGKNPGDTLTTRQENIISHFREKGSGGHYLYGGIESPEGTHEHPLGKNPGDYWNITTQPSKIKHFAAFPERLCERPILASSRVGDVVLDPLAGTGTVGIVAKRLGRKAILIDCVEDYCAIMKDRILKVEYQSELELK